MFPLTGFKYLSGPGGTTLETRRMVEAALRCLRGPRVPHPLITLETMTTHVHPDEQTEDRVISRPATVEPDWARRIARAMEARRLGQQFQHDRDVETDLLQSSAELRRR